MTKQTDKYDGVHFQVVLMNMRDGSVQGHAAGCADLTRGVRKFAEPSQATDVWDVLSKEQAREGYNADFDEETDGWYDINWLPCAKHVPAETEKAEEFDLHESLPGVVTVKRGPKWTYVSVNGEQVMEVRSEMADYVLNSVNFLSIDFS